MTMIDAAPLPGVLLTAFGVGITYPTASVAVTTGVEAGEQGVAGGLYVAAQQVGIASGLAALATVAAARTNADGGAAVAGYQLSFLVAVAVAVVVAAAGVVVIQLRSRVTTRLRTRVR